MEILLMEDYIALTNGILITPFQQVNDGCVLIKGNLIEKAGKTTEIKIPEGSKIIDVKGRYISPGFIDTHLHGAFGGSVMAATEKDLQLMAHGLAKCGVTSFLPTTLSASWEDIINSVDCISKAMKKDFQGSKILGIHIEGPYINIRQKGAQNPEHIYSPVPEQYLPLFEEYPDIIRVTAAPEIPGGLELGQELRNRRIIAAIGHSSASYQEILKAVENGYTHVTHMYSGMSGVQRINGYRISGVIESTLLLDELTTELIADGHHLPPSLMKLVLHSKGIDKVCLVTDSMAAAGLGPGEYELGGLQVIVESSIPKEFEIQTQDNNYVAKLTDRSAFASSVSTMDKLVKNMIKYCDLSIRQSVQLATYNAARIQRLENEIGILAENKKADITVFDDYIDIKMTIVNGKTIHKSF
jgi:N-acetylglucosamine-6-phosphate deacetylase